MTPCAADQQYLKQIAAELHQIAGILEGWANHPSVANNTAPSQYTANFQKALQNLQQVHQTLQQSGDHGQGLGTNLPTISGYWNQVL
jgi:hypothetical protein